MLTRLFSLFEGRHYRYLIVGILVFWINAWFAKWIFTFPYFSEGFFQKNLGNLIALELALICSYPLHKYITWLEGSEDFLKKLVQFHYYSFLGIIIRIFVFALLIFLGFGWLVSSFFSIGFVILLNFVSFDRFVFIPKEESIASNSLSYSAEGEGIGTLETIEEAVIYNRWIASKILDYLGEKNLEIGAGTGTIASITSENFPIDVFDLSKDNYNFLKQRFKSVKNIRNIGQDILSIKTKNYYDCIYSSNVMEHIEEDTKILNHSLSLLKKGGFFVAIVPAMPILYSMFDKKIGHVRRYSKQDIKRWEQSIQPLYKIKWLKRNYFNPIGAIGWLIKMKFLHQKQIKKQDAMIMNSLIPFIAWLDYLPLPFGQSMLLVLKKI
ncbi:methyltransferase domain-containing protein [Leptospira bouyouniensis]|uniref:methyltransferase domain-containing protein n=1 Tax=Leptospira bouyouniensis TaxID=2484911 RepID=UPI001091406B|nr:methyltransferase [Leptospira bouyouniensis]TGM80935.1 methyltransferase [Leptospira bouyouniensis]